MASHHSWRIACIKKPSFYDYQSIGFRRTCHHDRLNVNFPLKCPTCFLPFKSNQDCESVNPTDPLRARSQGPSTEYSSVKKKTNLMRLNGILKSAKPKFTIFFALYKYRVTAYNIRGVTFLCSRARCGPESDVKSARLIQASHHIMQ